MESNESETLPYITIWSVTISPDNQVSECAYKTVYDPTNPPAGKTDYYPTNEFITNAKKIISSLTWNYTNENGASSSQSAYCYIKESDPNVAICSNEWDR